MLFPVGAAWLAWTSAAIEVPRHTRIVERWVPITMRVLGVLFVMIAAALFIMPATMADLWPWQLSTFLAQLVSRQGAAMRASAAARPAAEPPQKA